jgi:hypothetical protein
MKEELITFETAQLAKEKGFNVPLDMFNHVFDLEDDRPMYNVARGILTSSPSTWLLRTTQSLLQKWLRKKHYIYVLVLKPNEIICTVNGKLVTGFKSNITYEEALEKGLQEALTTL